MKKLLLAIVLIVGCEENITHNHKHGCLDSQAANYDSTADIDNNSCEYDTPNMICAYKYEYGWWFAGFPYEPTTQHICIEDVSEEYCLYKAENSCAGLYGQSSPDPSGIQFGCTSGLLYYTSFENIHISDNCDEWCDLYESEGDIMTLSYCKYTD